MKIRLEILDLPAHDLRAIVDEDALDELADSLREHGQLQPIGVRPTDGDRFEVVYGARRTRAARSLGWTEIEAHVLENATEENTAAKKLIENVQREELTPIEEAYGLLSLIGDGEANVRSLQRQTGKSRDWIRNRLDLLALPEDVQGIVQAGLLGVGVAKALGNIENDEVRKMYLDAAVENGCTADQAAIWANQAQYAATGIGAVLEPPLADGELPPPPQVVEQQYHCFSCGKLHNWRKVNTLVVCGPCQSDIAERRLTNAES